MPETTALDYKFGTKLRDDKKVKLNVYELGGGRVLSNLLQTVFVGNSIEHAMIVLVIDLAKPGNSVDNLIYWLDVIRKSTQTALKELSQTNPAAFDLIQQRARAKWESHEDASKIKPQLIPVMVVGTKYDTFANTYESKVKRVLCDALRYIAHTNGCDLIFSSVREQQPARVYMNMIGNHVFDGSTSTSSADTNANSCLNIPSSTDKVSKINEPDGAGYSRASLEELYQQAVENNFTKE